VLHVCEALGGGTISAMAAMVDATPEIDHHLLARHRPGCDTGLDLAAVFTSVTELPTNPPRAVRRLRQRILGLFPDVVHAHSSFAGLLTRVVPLAGVPLVYSPHCFAVERRDVGPWARNFYALVERSLAARTDLLLAVAPHEIVLAERLGYPRSAYAVNRVNLALEPSARFQLPVRIVTAGRICAAKDPDHFIHVKRYVESELQLHASWEWLGGGREAPTERLRAAGVSVSGWLDQRELVARMSAAQIYLHTAAWEASPISILEAANLGLPLVLRGIPTLESLALPGICADVVATAERIAVLHDAETWWRASLESLELTERHSRQVQGDQLRSAYAQVIRGTPGDRLTRTAPQAPLRVAPGRAAPVRAVRPAGTLDLPAAGAHR
jgi:glycosyltransferase involved in cell wall biosynthesis